MKLRILSSRNVFALEFQQTLHFPISIFEWVFPKRRPSLTWTVSQNSQSWFIFNIRRLWIYLRCESSIWFPGEMNEPLRSKVSVQMKTTPEDFPRKFSRPFPRKSRLWTPHYYIRMFWRDVTSDHGIISWFLSSSLFSMWKMIFTLGNPKENVLYEKCTEPRRQNHRIEFKYQSRCFLSKWKYCCELFSIKFSSTVNWCNIEYLKYIIKKSMTSNEEKNSTNKWRKAKYLLKINGYMFRTCPDPSSVECEINKSINHITMHQGIK